MGIISSNPAAAAVTDDDVFLGNDGATTKKFPATVMKTYMQSGFTGGEDLDAVGDGEVPQRSGATFVGVTAAIVQGAPTNGQVPVWNTGASPSAAPVWTTVASGSVALDPIFDAKGDLPVGTSADHSAKLAAGTSGQVLTPDSTQSTGLKWGPGGGYYTATGRYWVPLAPALSFNNKTVADMFVCPIWIPVDVTVDRISCFVNAVGTAGSVVRMGIYNSTSAGMPSTLVVDGGTVATDAVTSERSVTVSQALTRGLYWVAAVGQVASPSLYTVSTAAWPFQGTLDSFHPTNAGGGFKVASVTGALPSTPTFATTKDALWLGLRQA